MLESAASKSRYPLPTITEAFQPSSVGVGSVGDVDERQMLGFKKPQGAPDEGLSLGRSPKI